MDDMRVRAKADLDRANERVRRLTSDLDAAKQEQHRLESFIQVLERYVGNGDGADPSRPATPARHNAGSGGKSLRLVGATIDEIRKAGRPLSIAELVQRLTDRGLQIGGARPAPNLAGYLSRSPLVRFEQGMGWIVVDLPQETDTASAEKEDAVS